MNFDRFNYSRRGFLGVSAATIGGAIASRALGAPVGEHKEEHHAKPPEPVPAWPAGSDPFDGLPLGVQSYTFRDRSFEKACEFLKSHLRLTHIEIYPGHVAGKSPKQIKEILEAHGIKANGYGVVKFTKDAGANKKIFEFCKEIGVGHISCDPDPDSFDSLDVLTKEFDITADIHDHGPGHRYEKVETIRAAIDKHSKMIGLCDDTGHFIRAGIDPLRAAEDFPGRTHMIHLKDFKKDEKGKWEDVELGASELKLQAFIDYLLSIKYRGALSIEFEGKYPEHATVNDVKKIIEAVANAPKKLK